MALRDLRSKAAAFLDRHASDWRYIHKMWSVWMLLFQCALNAAYASVGALQSIMDPIHFVVLNIALGTIVGALRIINQSDVPSA